jgi:hypothetical protein
MINLIDNLIFIAMATISLYVMGKFILTGFALEEGIIPTYLEIEGKPESRLLINKDY